MYKYLNELGYKEGGYCFNMPVDKSDKRWKKWKKQKKKYGFDDRELWDLDIISAQWLYCHLKMFLKIADKYVDLNYYKFNVPVLEKIPENELEYSSDTARECGAAERYTKRVYKELTQKECIELMIKYLKYFIKAKFCTDFRKEAKGVEKAKCAFEIYSIIFETMWW